MSNANPTTPARNPTARPDSAAPSQTARPKRPLGKALLPRPPAVKNAALSSALDSSLAALASTAAPLTTCSEQIIEAACALIDAAASTLPPQRNAEQDAAGAAQQNTGSSLSTPPNDGTIRDAEGFRAWVAERPESRARVAWYLAEVARTGKLAAPMEAAGIGVGILGCLEQRHPIIRAALSLVRNTSARRLVAKASEAVESVIDNPDDQQIQLKAASIAMQYGPKCASGDAGEGTDAAGGVQIVINMGAPATAKPVIPMESVGEASLFVQSR